ncbi:MAG: accessory factor UbiK family protein [Bordetella sp.]|nr:MAG: accessory factor UbiK family protein [Bordetella sp.]
MDRIQWLKDLQKNIGELINEGGILDIEQNFRALLTQMFNQLNLVTREEFDIQIDLFNHLHSKVEKLNDELNNIQTQLNKLKE